MPTFYNFKQDGNTHSFDDVFIPADAFRQGNLWIWGFNVNGQLGINDTTDRSTPVTTFAGGSNWKQVSAGSDHCAAIKTDGTLWTWGDDYYGTLGLNSVNVPKSTPVTTFTGGTNWKYVSELSILGGLAIKTDGTLWEWGWGQPAYYPTQVGSGTNWKQSSLSYYNRAVIKTDGTLWVWGYDNFGTLGVNDTTDRATPVTTFAGGTNWKQVASSKVFYTHRAAIKTDGTLWTWGNNFYGKLGINDTTNRSTPVTTFAGGSNWKQVSAGANHTAAIKTDGTLWVWGRNAVGQLGTNDTTDRATPVTTFAGGSNWKQVSGGGSHTVAIKTDGTLWTWGNNSYGELGTNDTTQRNTPVTTFAGGTNWKQVACGGYHTAAIKTSDDLIGI